MLRAAEPSWSFVSAGESYGEPELNDRPGIWYCAALGELANRDRHAVIAAERGSNGFAYCGPLLPREISKLYAEANPGVDLGHMPFCGYLI